MSINPSLTDRVAEYQTDFIQSTREGPRISGMLRRHIGGRLLAVPAAVGHNISFVGSLFRVAKLAAQRLVSNEPNEKLGKEWKQLLTALKRSTKSTISIVFVDQMNQRVHIIREGRPPNRESGDQSDSSLVMVSSQGDSDESSALISAEREPGYQSEDSFSDLGPGYDLDESLVIVSSPPINPKISQGLFNAAVNRFLGKLDQSNNHKLIASRNPSATPSERGDDEKSDFGDDTFSNFSDLNGALSPRNDLVVIRSGQPQKFSKEFYQAIRLSEESEVVVDTPRSFSSFVISGDEDVEEKVENRSLIFLPNPSSSGNLNRDWSFQFYEQKNGSDLLTQNLTASLDVALQGKTYKLSLACLIESNTGETAFQFLENNLIDALYHQIKEAQDLDLENKIQNGVYNAFNELQRDFAKEKGDPSGASISIALFVEEKIWVINLGFTNALIKKGNIALTIPDAPLSGFGYAGNRVIAKIPQVHYLAMEDSPPESNIFIGSSNVFRNIVPQFPIKCGEAVNPSLIEELIHSIFDKSSDFPSSCLVLTKN